MVANKIDPIAGNQSGPLPTRKWGEVEVRFLIMTFGTRGAAIVAMARGRLTAGHQATTLHGRSFWEFES